MHPNYFPIGVFILAATLLWAIGQPEWWPAGAIGERLQSPSSQLVKDTAVLPVTTPLPASALGFLCGE